MIKFFNKLMKNQRGFTLVELIVVIAILGILAAIAVPRLGGFTDKAKEAADEATAKTIESGIKLHLATDGEFTTIDGHDGDFTDGGEGLGDILGNVGLPQSGKSWKITVDGDEVTVEVSDTAVTGSDS